MNIWGMHFENAEHVESRYNDDVDDDVDDDDDADDDDDDDDVF